MSASQVSTTPAKQRNGTMELLKFAAAFFVVWIHAPFPGKLGQLVSTLARFAVPMFFLFSGYFNYGAQLSQVSRRARRIALLFLLGLVLGQLGNCICAVLSGGNVGTQLLSDIPTLTELFQLLILHIPPHTGSLWYLAGLTACYGVFRLHLRFWDENRCYTPFYILCLCLFVVFFFGDTLPPIYGSSAPTLLLRNGWFLGLPMFGLGMFLRQHQSCLLERFSLTSAKLLGILLLGIFLSAAQGMALSYGNVPFGTLLQLPALCLLAALHPRFLPLPQGLTAFLGKVSVWIYLLHLPILQIYECWFQYPLSQRIGEREALLAPLILAGVSFLCAAVLESVLQIAGVLSRRMTRKGK